MGRESKRGMERVRCGGSRSGGGKEISNCEKGGKTKKNVLCDKRQCQPPVFASIRPCPQYVQLELANRKCGR